MYMNIIAFFSLGERILRTERKTPHGRIVYWIVPDGNPPGPVRGRRARDSQADRKVAMDTLARKSMKKRKGKVLVGLPSVPVVMILVPPY
jgi:hypothetical protein